MGTELANPKEERLIANMVWGNHTGRSDGTSRLAFEQLVGVRSVS